MKKEVKHLYNKSIDSLTLSIELFNRPNECARVHGVLIFMDHSFKMLLKAAIIHKGGDCTCGGEEIRSKIIVDAVYGVII